MTPDARSPERGEKPTHAEPSYYHRLFESAPDCHLVTDLEAVIEESNLAASAMLGKPCDLLRGTALADYVVQEERASFQSHLERLREGDTESTRDWRVTLQGPAALGLASSVSVVPVQGPTGADALLWVIRSVPARGDSDSHPSGALPRYREIVESQTEIICRFSPEGTLTFVNAAYAQFAGESADELIGRNVLDASAGLPLQRSREYLETFTPSSPVRAMIHQAVGPDGQTQWQQWRDRAFFDEGGGVIEFQAVGTDVTAYHQAAIMEERARLARDLHDSATQMLCSMGLYIAAARDAVNAEDTASVLHCLTELERTSRAALKDMRLLIYELRPSTLQHDGLRAALRHRLEAVEMRAGVTATLTGGDDLGVPAAIEEVLYRVAQEALNNALKHSSAQNLSVDLSSGPDWVELQIADDGDGFEPTALPDEAGMGLPVMRRRGEEAGGEVEIRSAPGAGTTVRVRLPIQRAGQVAWEEANA